MKKKRQARLRKMKEKKEAKRAAGEEVSDDEEEREKKKMAGMTEEDRQKRAEMMGKSRYFSSKSYQSSMKREKPRERPQKLKTSAWRTRHPRIIVFSTPIMPRSTRRSVYGGATVCAIIPFSPD